MAAMIAASNPTRAGLENRQPTQERRSDAHRPAVERARPRRQCPSIGDAVRWLQRSAKSAALLYLVLSAPLVGAAQAPRVGRGGPAENMARAVTRAGGSIWVHERHQHFAGNTELFAKVVRGAKAGAKDAAARIVVHSESPNRLNRAPEDVGEELRELESNCDRYPREWQEQCIDEALWRIEGAGASADQLAGPRSVLREDVSLRFVDVTNPDGRALTRAYASIARPQAQPTVNILSTGLAHGLGRLTRDGRTVEIQCLGIAIPRNAAFSHLAPDAIRRLYNGLVEANRYGPTAGWIRAEDFAWGDRVSGNPSGYARQQCREFALSRQWSVVEFDDGAGDMMLFPPTLADVALAGAESGMALRMPHSYGVHPREHGREL